LLVYVGRTSSAFYDFHQFHLANGSSSPVADPDVPSKLYLTPMAGYSNPELVYEPAVPGVHRVLVQARGRTANYDLAVSDSGEEYAISIWPVEQPGERLELRNDGLYI
jgi:hypothetical protein